MHKSIFSLANFTNKLKKGETEKENSKAHPSLDTIIRLNNFNNKID